MTQGSSSPPRRSRWQLSLRMLLLLMALVGVGLTVYRWPWVESTWHDVKTTPVYDPFGAMPQEQPKVLYTYEQRTTYRRNWRAQPVKHGVEQLWRYGSLWAESHYSENQLHGPRRVYEPNNVVSYEVNYRDGMLHGPAWHRPAPDFYKWKGEFIQNEPHGPWETTVSWEMQMELVDPAFWVRRDFPESDWPTESPSRITSTKNPIRVLSAWDRGKRYGVWIWQTLKDGKALQSAEYLQGEVVSWDGVPVLAQFQNRLQQQANDPGAAEVLRFFETAMSRDWRVGHLYNAGNWGYCLQIEQEGVSPERLFIHGVNLPSGTPSRGAHPMASLCEFAAKSGHRLEFLYDGLLLVPVSPQPFLDPTGIDKVTFDMGSAQDREWNQIIDVMSSSHCGRECIQDLLKSTSIHCDVEQVLRGLALDPSDDHHRLFQRRRRDVIGLACYLSGVRCEQRGITLEFSSLSKGTVEASIRAGCTPLQPPRFSEPRHYQPLKE